MRYRKWPPIFAQTFAVLDAVGEVSSQEWMQPTSRLAYQDGGLSRICRLENFGNRQRKVERAADTRGRFHPNSPSVPFYDTADHRQAHALSLGDRGMKALECTEEFLLMFFGYAKSVVLDVIGSKE